MIAEALADVKTDVKRVKLDMKIDRRQPACDRVELLPLLELLGSELFWEGVAAGSFICESFCEASGTRAWPEGTSIQYFVQLLYLECGTLGQTARQSISHLRD
jgi:hypothetical protein